MNKKSLLAIERILTYIRELEKITNGKDDNYFYNGFEMPILCDLVDKIESNLNVISINLKRKYNIVKWNIIDSKKENDNGLIILKLGKIWELSSEILKNELYDSLNSILEKELPVYYKKYCNDKHRRMINKQKNDLF